ncbi:hypothetical protein BCR34DRAFT_586387 [Clohesyomyces aquaticus]|uniref:Uncharacterized protein n=1 Tax=Clohesyomyces aquaticus TaxID=1231657 RepID=A0A1Y1ZTL8_9PLEO|nr:hypothetical protein BCR34DRAFT_586387 [Clohesyomyces aquaticus]
MADSIVAQFPKPDTTSDRKLTGRDSKFHNQVKIVNDRMPRKHVQLVPTNRGYAEGERSTETSSRPKNDLKSPFLSAKMAKIVVDSISKRRPVTPLSESPRGRHISGGFTDLLGMGNQADYTRLLPLGGSGPTLHRALSNELEILNKYGYPTRVPSRKPLPNESPVAAIAMRAREHAQPAKYLARSQDKLNSSPAAPKFLAPPQIVATVSQNFENAVAPISGRAEEGISQRLLLRPLQSRTSSFASAGKEDHEEGDSKGG